MPYRLIKLFFDVGETVLDPFLGSGTTMKVANQLNRNSIGIEIIRDLETIIRQKVNSNNLEIVERVQGEIQICEHWIILKKRKKCG